VILTFLCSQIKLLFAVLCCYLRNCRATGQPFESSAGGEDTARCFMRAAHAHAGRTTIRLTGAAPITKKSLGQIVGWAGTRFLGPTARCGETGETGTHFI